MSDPTRYRVADNQAQLTLGGGILAVDPAGPLVEYADYARLKAENERLRKAGDEMVNRIRWFERPFKSVAKCPEIEAWNAAKEGNQS